MEYLSAIDFILSPLYLLIIYYISTFIRNARIGDRPEYKYYIPAISAKFIGGIGLCLVYSFYYEGGDTTQYFADSVSVNKLLFKNPSAGLDVIINGLKVNKLSYFDMDTGHPAYFRDRSTSFVVQVVSILTMFGFRYYIPTTIIVSWISFLGIWNLYMVFLHEFPKLSKQMAIAIFFIPSVMFWGSGILKDTFTLSAVGYFTYAFYTGIILKKNFVRNFIVMIMASYLIIIVKPYIFIALIPGCMIWLSNNIASNISGKFLRYTTTPAFIIFTIAGGYLLVTYLGNSLGRFSADQLLDRAVITQRDLKSSFYKGSSFDIGDFDSSLGSILRVSPNALVAGLFRPYLWESTTLFMIISALENTFFTIMFILVLWKTKVLGFFRFFFKNHLLTFSLIFSLFFAFSVGLSTSNFGSLVRYKIPAIPFFGASLFIIRNYLKEEKMAKKI